MLDHLVDMTILNLMFERSGDAAPVPKPMIKRRASPLKESPARDEEDETSACPIKQVADENPSASQQPENVNMEQLDYDRDSDDDKGPGCTDSFWRLMFVSGPYVTNHRSLDVRTGRITGRLGSAGRSPG